LCVEAAWPDAERLGSLVDAGVAGDHEEAAEAPLRAAAGEDVAERFMQVAGVAARCRAEHFGAARADRDAVFAGEPVQGLDGAAELGGDVV
jgi:hypothetical protein